MNWIQSPLITPSKAIASRFEDSLILSSEFSKKGFSTIDEVNTFLDPSIYIQSSPFSFPEMEKAVDRIILAFHRKELIGIWGDFDVDGQTSTAVLVDGLSRMGANVIYHIPIRATESHGMQLEAFKTFINSQPSLIITCDTGISEVETIEYARSIGIDVIVTDHHTLPSHLPNANATVNPHQLPDAHPLSYLAGVGAAFQIVRALQEKGMLDFDIGIYHDLVALGTIADLAPLKLENRYYSQMGLRQMNQKLRTAFKAMFEISQTRYAFINENSIGFNIAPRLNASGRLDDANQNVKFLLSDDQEFCGHFAKQLEQLNVGRKMAVESVLTIAERIINASPELVREPVLIIPNHGWERGVLGIAASKLVERYSHPVILLDTQNGIAAGSVRSYDGIDITSAIRENDKYLMHYGGHAMAAGLSLPEEKLAEFSRGLMKSVTNQLETLPEVKDLIIDQYVNFNAINDKLLGELDLLSPFGQGNPAPLFASQNLEVISIAPMANSSKHMQIKVQDSVGNPQTLTIWNSDMPSIPFDRIDLAFYIRPDEYRGNNSFYLEHINHQEYNPQSIAITSFSKPINFSDFRYDQNPRLRISEILVKMDTIQIWYEGVIPPFKENICDRDNLQKMDSLIILSAPQSQTVLNEVINISNPKLIYLFDFQHPQDDLKTFLLMLGGLVKHCLKESAKNVSLKSLSMQLGQTEPTIFYGLSWFKAQGNIDFECDPHDRVILTAGSEKKMVEIEKVEKNLNKSLKETSAFRNYYKRVNPTQLLRKKDLD